MKKNIRLPPPQENDEHAMQQATAQKQSTEQDSLRDSIAQLAKGIALSLENTTLSTELAKKFAGVADKTIDLQSYLSDLSPAHLDLIASNAGKGGATVDELIPKTLYPLELYLPTNSRKWNGNEVPVVAYDPLIDELKLKTIPGFTTFGKEIEFDAWKEPEDQYIVVVRISEKALPLTPKSENQSLKKYSKGDNIVKTVMSTNSGGYYHTMKFTELTFKSATYDNWKESWLAWPPEYYSKVWKCNNSSCSSYGLEQRHNLLSVPQWDPEPTSPDTELHDVDGPIAWSYTLSYILGAANKRMRVELWEEDGGSPDDMLQRMYPYWPSWGGGNGTVDWDRSGNPASHVRFVFTCYWVD